jgi:hypothetical protein
MLVGALMCGREDAIARLQTLNPRTRRRINELTGAYAQKIISNLQQS